MTRRLSVIAACMLLTAADWPQWRGPNRDGISAETGLLKSWPKSGPKLLWTSKDVGLGYSSVAVVGNVVYTAGADNDDTAEFVAAIDATTGKLLWKQKFGGWFDNNWGGGPRGCPTVDGDSLYILGAKGDLACLDVKSGQVLWTKNFKKDFDGKLMSGWGYSESVLVDGEKVICSPGGLNGTMVALKKSDGELIWRSADLTDDAAYSSAVISEACGIRQYVQMTGSGVAGVRAEDGKLLWRVEGKDYRVAVIPTPVASGDLVFATTDYGARCKLIKLSKGGPAGIQADVVYENKDMENHHGGVLLIDGHIYGSHRNANQKRRLPFVCMNLETGKVAWDESQKLEPSSIVYADGMIHAYGQETGACVMVKPSAKGYQEAGRFTIPQQTKRRKPQGAIWTHPVVANGKLFLRDQELLFAFDLSNAQAQK